MFWGGGGGGGGGLGMKEELENSWNDVSNADTTSTLTFFLLDTPYQKHPHHVCLQKVRRGERIQTPHLSLHLIRTFV